MLPDFEYIRARSLRHAAQELQSAGAHVHAGATDLLGCLRDRVFPGQKLVSISGLPELKGIVPSPDGGLRIGAMSTLAEIAGHPRISKEYAALAQAAASAASPQLRNQGTIGGNLCQRPRCWYFRGDFHCFRKGGDQCFAMQGENDYHAILGGAGCYVVHPSDTAPALMSLGARVRIAGPGGVRIVPLENFFVRPEQDVRRENVLKPGEVLVEVLLPATTGVRSTYQKARARQTWDFALAGVAVALRISEGLVRSARIVLSGVAPAPWRVHDAEAAITGRRIDEDVARLAGEAAVKGAEPLEQNAYKVHLVRGIVAVALMKLARENE